MDKALEKVKKIRKFIFETPDEKPMTVIWNWNQSIKLFYFPEILNFYLLSIHKV